MMSRKPAMRKAGAGTGAGKERVVDRGKLSTAVARYARPTRTHLVPPNLTINCNLKCNLRTLAIQKSAGPTS